MQLLRIDPVSTSRPLGSFRAEVLRTSVAPAPSPGQQYLPRDIASRFGRRVRELRRARGKTQAEIALTFGIDRTFISDVERGRKGVCLPTLEVFALEFGVSLSDLFRGL